MPSETEIEPNSSNCSSLTRLNSRLARPRASPASHDGMITANSSPPIRHGTSDDRTISLRISAIATSIWSPVECP
jgi:hypothetical protein